MQIDDMMQLHAPRVNTQTETDVFVFSKNLYTLLDGLVVKDSFKSEFFTMVAEKMVKTKFDIYVFQYITSLIDGNVSSDFGFANVLYDLDTDEVIYPPHAELTGVCGAIIRFNFVK